MDRHILGPDPDPGDDGDDDLTEAERIAVLLQVAKYRIGSTTRIALGMDPEDMAVRER